MNKKDLTKTFMMIEFEIKPMIYTKIIQSFNPLTAKLFNLNFHLLEVVSR